MEKRNKSNTDLNEKNGGEKDSCKSLLFTENKDFILLKHY